MFKISIREWVEDKDMGNIFKDIVWGIYRLFLVIDSIKSLY